MPRSVIIPAALLLTAALGACSDGPSAPEANSVVPLNAVSSRNTLTVSTTAELLAALRVENPAKHVLLAPGTYELTSTLIVPDGTTLVGSGTMGIDKSTHLPTGMAAASRSTLMGAASLAGDMVVLGNRAGLSRLMVVDVARPNISSGSVVVVKSRGAGDVVHASIEDCEIITPNVGAAAPIGPTGRGIAIYTDNRNGGAAPPADVGAALTVNVSHSLIRAPRGSGVFVINFAAHGNVSLTLTENVVGGGMVLTGGASKPNAVTGANVTVMSRSNFYRADPGPTPLSGWQVYGGAGAPVPGVVTEATTGNTLRVHSVHDRIEGFTRAITAAGASRPTPNPSAISFNSMSLELHGTQLSSIVADFFLVGSRSLVLGTYPDAGNALRVLAQGVGGSGVRDNLYAATFGPAALGADNSLEFVGSLNAFSHTNSNIEPHPPAAFFTASH